MDTPKTTIAVDSFAMQFGSNRVINDLSFEVYAGETFGFLGANGSGKTTTIRTLLGLMQPTAGSLTINGQRFNTNMTQVVGYLPEERGLYRKENVLDTMIYFAILKGVDRHTAKSRAKKYLERVGLEDKSQSKIASLSGGQQQKVQLGITILHEPSLLILDEPTKGLDPINRGLLMDIIEERRANGATIFLVSHDMDDVEKLCDRILMLKDGKSVLYGTIPDVKSQFGQEIIAIQHDGSIPTNPSLYTIRTHQPHYAELIPSDKSATHEILQFLADKPELHITSFSVQRESLNDIFVQIYSDTDEEQKNA